ncbi:hypothetical protein O9H85_35105 [Paenibacillus filicis]|uniref:Uncharacterized protein n=1 Tax=Paenibacillus gyeongsangnamensis TaxID=3388067 RepID=A0ABT4QKS4_9BACL|nr:hypothetical protein [Paenibacillus filicis]MCZ8517479.1 hypothetical protein [Paenibacillus filicis]
MHQYENGNLPTAEADDSLSTESRQSNKSILKLYFLRTAADYRNTYSRRGHGLTGCLRLIGKTALSAVFSRECAAEVNICLL